MSDPLPPHSTFPIFRWTRIEQLGEPIATEDDSVEILRDQPHSQFSRITLGAERGTGVMEYLCEEGLRVLILDCNFASGLNCIVEDEGWIRLNFSPRITIDMAIGGKVNVHENEPSWRIFRLPPGGRSVEIVPGGAPARWITVCCTPEWLARLAGTDVEDLPFQGWSAAGDEDSLIYRHYNFSRSLLAVSNELFERGQSPQLRAAFVSAKATELAILALDYLLNDQSVAQFVGLRLSQRDIEIIDEVRAFMGANLVDIPSVNALARKMGINRNKLFYGFKSRFGVSLSDYMAELRLTEAARMIEETAEPLASIAAAVGFRHQCNFSTAFRRRFGVSPRTIRARTGPGTPNRP